MPMDGPHIASQVVKAMSVLPHRAVRTAPNYNSSMNLLEMPIPLSAFMGFEGLDVRAKGAHVLWLIPLWSVGRPQ